MARVLGEPRAFIFLRPVFVTDVVIMDHFSPVSMEHILLWIFPFESKQKSKDKELPSVNLTNVANNLKQKLQND